MKNSFKPTGWAPAFAAAAGTLTVLSCGAHSQPAGFEAVKTLPLQEPFATKSAWNITAYQAAGEPARTGDTPARICFWKPPSDDGKDCTSLTSVGRITENQPSYDTLVYQSVTNVSVVPLTHTPKPQMAVKLEATMFYGGSGSATQVSLWTYDPDLDQFHSILALAVPNLGEVRLFDDGPLAGDIVTAEYVWGAGETHYEPHHYWIELKRFNPVSGHYDNVLSYLTSGKYDGEGKDIEVVQRELPQIQLLLRSIGPTGPR